MLRRDQRQLHRLTLRRMPARRVGFDVMRVAEHLEVVEVMPAPRDVAPLPDRDLVVHLGILGITADHAPEPVTLERREASE